MGGGGIAVVVVLQTFGYFLSHTRQSKLLKLPFEVSDNTLTTLGK